MKLPGYLQLQAELASKEAEIEKLRAVFEKQEQMRDSIKFRCGCFLTVFLDKNEIKNCFSCCDKHEFSNARPEFFSLDLQSCQCQLNSYQKEKFIISSYYGWCQNCDNPVIIR